VIRRSSGGHYVNGTTTTSLFAAFPTDVGNSTTEAAFDRTPPAGSRQAGKPFRLVGHTRPLPDTEGENRFWRGCAIRRIRSPGDTVTERLFGAIVERDGRFRFYSYGNEL
jgi:hypothetical protein